MHNENEANAACRLGFVLSMSLSRSYLRAKTTALIYYLSRGIAAVVLLCKQNKIEMLLTE
jgi:hypothetical protein